MKLHRMTKPDFRNFIARSHFFLTNYLGRYKLFLYDFTILPSNAGYGMLHVYDEHDAPRTSSGSRCIGSETLVR